MKSYSILFFVFFMVLVFVPFLFFPAPTEGLDNMKDMPTSLVGWSAAKGGGKDEEAKEKEITTILGARALRKTYFLKNVFEVLAFFLKIAR
jgi:hypothetical protein